MRRPLISINLLKASVLDFKYIGSGLMIFAIAACAPSGQIVVGRSRPAIAPERVEIFSHPPPHYEQIAIVDATSEGFPAGDDTDRNALVERCKLLAAKLGANGVILENYTDGHPATVDGTADNLSSDATQIRHAVAIFVSN
jgi:hypothetical protein